jgi:DNA (cytosine-5)-methyltransferase 1
MLELAPLKTNISEVTRLKVIDVFAGCGGASRGFIDAGFDIVAAVEIDPSAAESYRRNFPRVPLFEGDIGAVDLIVLGQMASIGSGDVDVVIGCPPCQGFSTHRLNESGARDPRNSLIETYARFILMVKPRAFVFENVPGLLRIGQSEWQEFVRVLGEGGYQIASGLLDAANFGTPQRRRRWTAIGHYGDTSVPLPSPTHGPSTSTPWLSVRDAFAGLSEIPSGASCVADRMHSSPVHCERILSLIASVPRNGGSRSEIATEHQLKCHLAHNGHKDVYGRLSWDKPSGTITGGCTQPSKGRFIHPEADRGLTLREAARLQGFEDSHLFAGTKQECALQIGNVVPPPLARCIAEEIKAALSGRATDRALAVAAAQ